MKKLVIYTFISLLFFGCKEEPKRTDYTINGTAKGVYNGIRVHLNGKDEKGRNKVMDTQMVVNEQFSFEGKVEAPTLYYISVNSVPGQLPIMVENSEIHVDINKTKIADSKITGSKSQMDYEAYQTGFKDIEKELPQIKMELRNARAQRDMAKQESLNNRLENIENKKIEYTINTIKENDDNYFSLFLLRSELDNPKIDIEKFMDVFNGLSSDLKTSKAGTDIKTKLDNLYSAYQKRAHLEIGKIAPNFEAPAPDGKMISLNDIKGKVTIIDFWAAWCGPCRRENPNVVKVYNKYHDQGLEIIGVSLDGTRSQKDPKKLWMDAIAKDNLTWHQVSNLKYFNDPVAQLYNISSIPATYILDKDGKIVAKNLRGNALELKVAELLK